MLHGVVFSWQYGSILSIFGIPSSCSTCRSCASARFAFPSTSGCPSPWMSVQDEQESCGAELALNSGFAAGVAMRASSDSAVAATCVGPMGDGRSGCVMAWF